MWQERYNKTINNIDVKRNLSNISENIIKFSIFETNKHYIEFLKKSELTKNTLIKCNIKKI